jgi:twitching motility two-component system response regulator PilH
MLNQVNNILSTFEILMEKKETLHELEIETKKPDVVITDLVMPGMSGLELCRSLKKNIETKDVPIVACTSKNQELDKLWGMKQGIDVYITKPFSREDILRAVRSVA